MAVRQTTPLDLSAFTRVGGGDLVPDRELALRQAELPSLILAENLFSKPQVTIREHAQARVVGASRAPFTPWGPMGGGSPPGTDDFI